MSPWRMRRRTKIEPLLPVSSESGGDGVSLAERLDAEFTRLAESWIDLESPPDFPNAPPAIYRIAHVAHAVARDEDPADDAEAVRALRAMALNRKDLRYAAAVLRSASSPNDSAITYRANDLLLVAAGVRPHLTPAGADQKVLFERVDDLWHHSTEGSYLILCGLEPRLVGAARQVRDAWLTIGAEAYRFDEPDRTVRGLAIEALIQDELQSLVGLDADQSDVLLRTRAAYEIAIAYLQSLRFRRLPRRLAGGAFRRR